MPVYVKKTGVALMGTYELIPGAALVERISESGRPVYGGGTEVFWDNSVTQTDHLSRTLWVTEDGDIIPLFPHEITNEEPTDEED